MDALITSANAEKRILANLPRLAAETAPLSHAAGRILASPLAADRPLPPYNRVMMDGICFRADDARNTNGRLHVAGLHPAGASDPGPLPADACWEIMTGACLPPDCDTIVRYEDVTRDGNDAVVSLDHVVAGRHLHAMGSDFQTADELVPAGTRLGSREIAVAATVGCTDVPVVIKPRITIVTTGDELVPPEQTPAAHQVRQSNNHALLAALHHIRSNTTTAIHAPDDKDDLTAGLQAALSYSDLILICGGISKGKRDFVRPALESLLGDPVFHGVAQRPGKPLAFWKGPPPVFALPGNPMSVLVTFHRYVLPALAAMTGTPFQRQTVALAEEFTFAPPFTYFVPVSLTSNAQAAPHTLANSGDFASSIDSQGFVAFPSEPDTFPVGTLLPYQPWL